MDIFHAIILGAIEGATEFLPVSSTGHLILVSHLLGIPQSSFLTSFEIAIQLGAISAVALLYWRSFFKLDIVKRLIVGFIPTAIIGFGLYSFVKHYLLTNEILVIITLIVGGIFLIAFELLHREKEEIPADITAITYRQAALVGVFQSLAMVPGVSRSAATIVGGLVLGIRRAAIVEFSFLLAVPTMGAAVALDVLKTYKTFPVDALPTMAYGFVTAFLVALVAIRFLLNYVKKAGFIPFGVYRILIALFFLVLIF